MLVDNLRQVQVLLAVVCHELIKSQQIGQKKPPALAIAQLQPHACDKSIANRHLCRLLLGQCVQPRLVREDCRCASVLLCPLCPPVTLHIGFKLKPPPHKLRQSYIIWKRR